MAKSRDPKAYGPNDVERVAGAIVRQLARKGVETEVSRSTSNGLTVYIRRKGDMDKLGVYAPNIRISDHDGGWGLRRGAPSFGFNLAKPLSAGQIRQKIKQTLSDAVAISDPGKHEKLLSDSRRNADLASAERKATQAKASRAFIDSIAGGKSPKEAEKDAQRFDQGFNARMFVHSNKRLVAEAKQRRVDRDKNNDGWPDGQRPKGAAPKPTTKY
jgi:hypothetical protein